MCRNLTSAREKVIFEQFPSVNELQYTLAASSKAFEDFVASQLLSIFYRCQLNGRASRFTMKYVPFLLFLLLSAVTAPFCPIFCRCSTEIPSQPNAISIWCEYPEKIGNFEGFPFESAQLLSFYCRSNSDGITDFVKDKFINFTNLKHLAIENCRTESLQAGTFNGLPGLLTLKLSELKMASKASFNFAEDIFAGLRSLTQVNLSGLHIEYIKEGTFQDTSQLKILDLSDNLLTNFSGEELDQKTQLKRLYLYDNKLTDCNLTGYHSLESVILGGRNRFSCDCTNNSAIVEWFRSPNALEKVTDINDVLCADNNNSNWKILDHPSYTKGSMKISSFVSDRFVCKTPLLSTNLLRLLFAPAFIFALIMIVVASCYYVIANCTNENRRTHKLKSESKPNPGPEVIELLPVFTKST